MSKSTPSLLALLGLVAVAGYQNRGKISEMLADARQGSAALPGLMPKGAARSQGGFLSEISSAFDGTSPGGGIAEGLRDLVGRFAGKGPDNPAETWVSTQPNRPTDSAELEAALGDHTIVELVDKTGLTRQELLQRLHVALPQVVDRLTPEGRLPTEAEARHIY